MEEPLPFEMDRLYADLKAAGESKTMNQHEAAKARHAAERLAEGINPTGREGCEHPLDELAARTEHARRRADGADPRMSVKARQAPLWPLMALATLIAVMAFVLSFDALRTLGIACGIQPALGWMFPLIVDVPVLAFTWATWVFKTRGMGQGYPWAMLILFSAVSLVGNALHAHPVETNGMLLPDWTASLLMTMPPIALLATSHMMVTAASRSYDLETVEPEQPEEAEPSTEELWPIESEQPDEEPIEEPEAVEKPPEPIEEPEAIEEPTEPIREPKSKRWQSTFATPNSEILRLLDDDNLDNLFHR